MPTQTINTLGITGKTYTGKLFTVEPESDTVYQTASATTESTNRKTNYVCTFADVAQGLYLLQLWNASNVSESNYYVRVLDGETEFRAYETPELATNALGWVKAIWGVSSISLPADPDEVTTTLKAIRGDYWSLSITGLGDISDRTKLYFGIKSSTDIDDDDDTDCLVQIEETDGLLFIQKEATSTTPNTLGGITVADATAGDITVTLRGVESKKLIMSREEIFYAEVQKQYLVSGNSEPETMKQKFPFELITDVNRTVT